MLGKEVVKERRAGPRQGSDNDRRAYRQVGDVGIAFELLVQASLDDEAFDQLGTAAEAARRRQAGLVVECMCEHLQRVEKPAGRGSITSGQKLPRLVLQLVASK